MTSTHTPAERTGPLDGIAVPDDYISSHTGLATVKCNTDTHLQHAPSRTLREGYRVRVIATRHEATWQIESIRCLHCPREQDTRGSNLYDAYDGQQVIEAEATLAPPETDESGLVLTETSYCPPHHEAEYTPDA